MARTFSVNFMGDVMLGRLIDQMFPQHVEEPEEQRIARSLLTSKSGIRGYGPDTPWSNTLPLLHSADLNLVNLETSVTTHSTKWPNKVFNYRMHPANVSALHAARVHYASLANNHTLDFCEPGLFETVRTLNEAGIANAGAGQTPEEATRPAILRLQGSRVEHEVHCWAVADHPDDWAAVPSFHFLDYTQETRMRLKDLITSTSSKCAALKIISCHWGPNYSWRPADEIRDMAHFLIDDCGIDIIHGHSSHHVQGIEQYKGKLIMYGCGDFIDDYALNSECRNDLSGVWRVTVQEDHEGSGLSLRRLEMYPTKIENFRVRRLGGCEHDSMWVRQRIEDLSKELGTEVEIESDGEGRAILDLT